MKNNAMTILQLLILLEKYHIKRMGYLYNLELYVNLTKLKTSKQIRKKNLF